ncbi:hypothetical protein BHE74_00017621 [Ensete ventricosum]|nr:hypothetical protein GW17_00020356 [Ensete ventricosum]RWW74442.1 hypothetical protein BHE74_00017621 [Ensete ventricosum]
MELGAKRSQEGTAKGCCWLGCWVPGTGRVRKEEAWERAAVCWVALGCCQLRAEEGGEGGCGMGAGGRRRRMLSGKRGRGKILAAGAGREAKDDTGRDATKWGKRDGNTPVHAGAGAATKGGRRWRLRRRRMRMRREKDTEEEPTGGRRRRRRSSIEMLTPFGDW